MKKYIALILLALVVFSGCNNGNKKMETTQETSTPTTKTTLQSDAVVEKLLSSLKNGDTNAVKEIIGRKDSDFSKLSTVKVLSYSYEKAENDIYNIKLNVISSGFDKIPAGESRWGFSDDPQYGTRFYQIGDDERAIPQPEQITRWYVNFIDTFFEKPTDLKIDVITDAILGLSFKFDENNERLSTAKFKAAAEKYFGLINFEAKNSVNYDKKTDTYNNLGHGGNEFGWDTKSTLAGDTATVDVTYYHEPSNFSIKETHKMTLKKNSDGSYHMVSYK